MQTNFSLGSGSLETVSLLVGSAEVESFSEVIPFALERYFLETNIPSLSSISIDGRLKWSKQNVPDTVGQNKTPKQLIKGKNMSDQFTSNLNLTKPAVGQSVDSWGGKINSNLDSVDNIFSATGTEVDVRFNSANFNDNKKAVFGTTDALEIFLMDQTL